MKKYLTTLLVVVMLFSLTAFADSKGQAAGEKLKSYGIIKGNAKGELMVGSELSREETLAIFIRMLGKDKQAMETAVSSSFIDIPADSWAKSYIAYGQMNKLTYGIGDNMFGYGYKTTTHQAVIFMLRALGYGEAVPYQQAMIKGTQLGLLKDVSSTNPDNHITRGDMFIIMQNTLSTKPMGEEKALMYKLGLEKFDAAAKKAAEEKAKAEAAKKAAEEAKKKGQLDYSGTAEVEKITNNGLNQILVHFTAPVKSAGDYSNYDLDTKGTARIDKNSDITLSADGKLVIINLSKAAENQDKIDLEITDVADKDRKINDYEMIDQKIPSVELATVVGERTIKLVFDEPMSKGLTENSNYKLTDKKGSHLSIKNVKASDNNKVALVEAYSRLSQGTVITVKNVEDYAGYRVKPNSNELDFNVDKDAPSIVGYKNSSLNEVTLIFDEDIKVLKKAKAFYHTNTGNKAEKVEAKGKELKLTFAKGNELPAGTAYIYIDEEAISDFWNNKNERDLVYDVSIKADKSAPKLKGKYKAKSERELVLTFDQKIEKSRRYEVELEKDGRDANIRIRSYFDDEKLTLKFDEDLRGEYELYIKGIEDEVGNEADNIKLTIDMDDATAPKADRFTAMAMDINKDEQLIIVNFKDEMKESDIEDESNYQLGGKDLDDLKAEIRAIDDNSKAEITIPAKEYDLKAENLKKGNKLLTIGRMADAAGNHMDELSVHVDVLNGDDLPISVSKVMLTREDEVVFAISGILEDVNIKQFEIYKKGEKQIIASLDSDQEDQETKIRVRLENKVGTNPSAEALTYKVLAPKEIGDDASHNKFGQKLGASSGDIKDECAPKVDKVVYVDDKTIHVLFTEDLNSEYFSSRGLNGFDVDGGEIDSAVLARANLVEIKGDDFSRSTDVIYKDEGIYDKNGNKLKSFEYTDKLSRD